MYVVVVAVVVVVAKWNIAKYHNRIDIKCKLYEYYHCRFYFAAVRVVLANSELSADREKKREESDNRERATER